VLVNTGRVVGRASLLQGCHAGLGASSTRFICLLTCEALVTTQEKFAFAVFERTFKESGLPRVIRTDNGVPFAAAHAIYGAEQVSRVVAAFGDSD
jgi:hypothetical protein